MDGEVVPQLRDTESLDMMVEVMSDMSLHLHAADGFLRVGLKANLTNADLDREIVREVGHWWRELGMRDKVTAAVAEVQEEVEAGRLRWCYKDIMRLVLPHPRKGIADDVLRNLGEESLVADEGGDDGPACEEALSEADDSEEAEDNEWGNEQDLQEWKASSASAEAAEVGFAVAEPTEPTQPKCCSAKEAAEAQRSDDIAKVYDNIAEELQGWGDIAGSAYMRIQRDKERKRARELAREDSDVLRSLLDYTAAQEASERKRQRIRDETCRKRLQLDGLMQDVKKVNATLKAQKARLLEAEATLSIKHSVRRYSLEDLGQGRRSGGGPTAKKARCNACQHLVLDFLEDKSWISNGSARCGTRLA